MPSRSYRPTLRIPHQVWLSAARPDERVALAKLDANMTRLRHVLTWFVSERKELRNRIRARHNGRK